MPRVLILNRGADTGGGSIKIKQAFDRYAPPGWSVRAVRGSDNYIGYPADAVWPAGEPLPDDILKLWDEADLIHMVNDERLGRQLPYYADKPKLVHYRGWGHWRNPGGLDSVRARGLIALVSTPNLVMHAPDFLEWMPNVCPVDDIAGIRARAYQDHLRPLLVHAPGAMRESKSTDGFLAAMAPLAGRLDIDVIDGLPLVGCLERKARGDLLYDQIKSGAYGSNALEAWAMGMPVLAGLGLRPKLRKWYHREIGYIPFVEVSLENAAAVVTRLLDDPEEAREWGRIGHQYVRDFHDEPRVVERLISVYQRVLA